ncbi:MAG: trypsin-like peptidase domain-containing protein [Acidobacteria bacterium]|nr:trypsin-like peptidase domain-containing protein [Acidobacteriota bacterium]MCA1642553.1 trypsin-like peptidase domain-containing protein [Acidobacteriota bacterium]
MFRVTARQILAIAFASALFAAGLVFVFDRYGSRLLQQSGSAAFTETPVPGITSPSVASDEQNNIEVYRALSPGVVLITSVSSSDSFFDAGEREGTGSGSVIDAEGHILTNNHVVAGAQRLTVSFGDKTFPARPVGVDPDTDLAVIKVDAPREMLKPVPFGDSDRVVVGQKVLAIGNPFGFARTLTTGVISGLQRPIRARNGRLIEGALQTDASINPGNSGGPLLDTSGRIIGINTLIYSPSGGSSGVGFAIPVSIAKRIVPQLITDGAVVRPRLGIVPFNVGNIQARLPVTEGVGIYQVNPNSAAAAAGLKGLQQDETGEVVLGDIIVGVDGEKIANGDDLYRVLDKHHTNDVVQVEIFRDGRRVRVPVRLIQDRGAGRRRLDE